ncbi:MAG: FAD-dependent oxidoreductase [Alphaproteobacteria bacterium]|nr:FAD-dependent oxidoreductase [Alphaproteobacteria bacterium]
MTDEPAPGWRSESEILDVMRVPSAGDPAVAVVTVPAAAPAREVDCDVLIVGGGLGGVAATLAATAAGASAVLLEETDWLGGQATSQGVSALDEHEHIEVFGGTRSYYAFREAIRDHYRVWLDGTPEPVPFNPGNSWVSRLAFEPVVAVDALNAMLAPAVGQGHLEILLRNRAVRVESEGTRLLALDALDLDGGGVTRVRFRYLLDATELGDLLPLSGADYVVGAESIAQTSEPDAQPEAPRAHCVQSCTYTFALDRGAEGEDHRIPEPEKYAHYRDTQPYSLEIHVHGGEIYGEDSGWLQYALFDQMDGTKGGLWTYRRLLEAARYPGRVPADVTMFNWPGIDYRDAPLVEQSPHDLARALQDAKLVSLGFVHWLQNEVTDPGGRLGFPELRLRPDVMGSADGLSKYPYIRECRRLEGLRRIVEQDVAVAYQPGPRAAHFEDSVGIGWYPIDIHQAGEGDVGLSTRTKPFQIPLGALIPKRVENLLAANKNIATTHITNGCYRLHPVEWNIGEATGTLAAMAIETGVTPATIRGDAARRLALQRRLLARGVPQCWLVDVGVSDPDFVATQRLAMAGGYGGGEDRLTFEPEAAIDATARAAWLTSAAGRDAVDPCGADPVSRRAFAAALLAQGLI